MSQYIGHVHQLTATLNLFQSGVQPPGEPYLICLCCTWGPWSHISADTINPRSSDCLRCTQGSLMQDLVSNTVHAMMCSLIFSVLSLRIPRACIVVATSPNHLKYFLICKTVDVIALHNLHTVLTINKRWDRSPKPRDQLHKTRDWQNVNHIPSAGAFWG